MTDNKHDWLDRIRKLLGWLAGLIAFGATLVGFINLWQGNMGLATMLLALGMLGGWLGCFYLAFKRPFQTFPGGPPAKTKRYHSKHIRSLLVEGFTAEELRQLCFDEFRPVHDKLAENTGKSSIVDQLVEYADRKLLLDNLLDWAKEKNPIRYEIYQPYYDDLISPTASSGDQGEAQSQATWQYPRRRPWALAGLVTIPLLAVGAVGYIFYPPSYCQDKMIILVANFAEPEAEDDYRVTEVVLTNLQDAVEPYGKNVEVEALGWAINRVQGKDIAINEGKKRKAAIVIWGWYSTNTDPVLLSVNFELLCSPEDLSEELEPEARGTIRKMPLAGLKDTTLHTQLSEEMAYLSLFTVGVVRYTREDWDGAILSFDDALSRTDEPIPGLAKSIFYLYHGNANYHKGNYSQAITDYNQAIRFNLNPEEARAYYNRGLAHYEQSDMEAAIADYSEAIARDPDYAHAYNNRGIARYKSGDLDNAIADYDQAIELNPKEVRAYNNGGLANLFQFLIPTPKRETARVYNNRGLASEAQGDLEAAIADYDQAIALDPNNALAYINRGAAYLKQGNWEAAIKDSNSAIELLDDPADVYNNRGLADAYNNRGLAHEAQGDLESAIKDYKRAIELKPDYAIAYNSLGRALQDQGDLGTAIDNYNKAIELKPDLAEAYNNRGLAYFKQENLELAIKDYKRAIELKPDLVEAYNNRGLAHEAQGDLESAIKDYKRAIELKPDYAIAYNNRGLAYYYQGKLDDAIADFNTAMTLDPENAHAYYYRGLVHTVQGDLNGAIADCQMVLKLSNDAQLRESAQQVLKCSGR